MSERPADTIREAQAEYAPPGTSHRMRSLISSGRLKPASGNLLDLGRPPDKPHDLSISKALREQRAER
ncbi:MAG: hypothetical protein GY719_43255 [bacterium]|nr:hypothetical protein [bacterium]